jgi:hypothetical protein
MKKKQLTKKYRRYAILFNDPTAPGEPAYVGCHWFADPAQCTFDDFLSTFGEDNLYWDRLTPAIVEVLVVEKLDMEKIEEARRARGVGEIEGARKAKRVRKVKRAKK